MQRRLVTLLGGVCLLGWQASAGGSMDCSLYTEKDALATAGGPLGEVVQSERKPEAENGDDHTTSCGYFPKGFDFDKADGPPERGVEVQIHRLPSAQAARRMYDFTLEAVEEMARQTGMRNPDGKAATPLAGAGEAAFVRVLKLMEPEPGQARYSAMATFVKGSVMGQVTVWKTGKTAPHGESGAAARLVASRLP